VSVADPASDTRPGGGTRARAVDGCVFHEWSSIQDLAPYLSRGWRDLLTTLPSRQIQPSPLYVDPLGGRLPGTYPSGGTTGLQFETLVEHVLDAWSPERVVLGYADSVLMTASASLYAAKAIVSAINSWTVDAWLCRDERLYGLILVSAAMPEAAVAEIDRMAGNDRMVGVAIGANALNLTFGHPAYHPILAAAAEHNLPVVVQVEADLAATLLTPPVAGGQAAMYGEYHALNAHSLMSHAAAMIVQGVFEQFPKLRVLLLGGGVTWIPGYLWRLDYAYRFNHQAVPWLTRPPSEYFRDFIRVGTHQLERSVSRESLAAVLETTPWLQSSLVYTSGFPSADALGPGTVAARLPDGWVDDALYNNAFGLFRWPNESPRS
jgi:uncharacterized protein